RTPPWVSPHAARRSHAPFRYLSIYFSSFSVSLFAKNTLIEKFYDGKMPDTPSLKVVSCFCFLLYFFLQKYFLLSECRIFQCLITDTAPCTEPSRFVSFDAQHPRPERDECATPFLKSTATSSMAR